MQNLLLIQDSDTTIIMMYDIIIMICKNLYCDARLFGIAKINILSTHVLTVCTKV